MNINTPMGIINWESKLGLKSKTNIVVQKTQPIALIMQLSKTRNFELLYATMMSPINVESSLKRLVFSKCSNPVFADGPVRTGPMVPKIGLVPNLGPVPGPVPQNYPKSNTFSVY